MKTFSTTISLLLLTTACGQAPKTTIDDVTATASDIVSAPLPLSERVTGVPVPIASVQKVIDMVQTVTGKMVDPNMTFDYTNDINNGADIGYTTVGADHVPHAKMVLTVDECLGKLNVVPQTQLSQLVLCGSTAHEIMHILAGPETNYDAKHENAALWYDSYTADTAFVLLRLGCFSSNVPN